MIRMTRRTLLSSVAATGAWTLLGGTPVRAATPAASGVATRPGSRLVLVTHMGPIKALLAAALGVDFASVRRMVLDPATVTVIDWSASPVLRLFNSHAHLGWSNARWLAQPR